MSKLNAMSLRALSAVLPKATARKIYFFAAARILANLLDIVGLAGIALLATSFGAFASGNGSAAAITLPILGDWVITEVQAVLIALLIATTFVLKSAFSIWLNLRSSLFVASVESDLSRKLAIDYFSGGSEGEDGFGDNLSEFQNISAHSTYAIGQFINARISAIAESSLLVSMVVVFTFVNPIATLAMFVFLATVLLALAKAVTKRIKNNGEIQLEGSQRALQITRDLFGIRREARASGVSSDWIQRFASGRSQWASSTAIINTLSGLPRYVIETSLILGIFSFLAGVVVFSDLASQAVTIGVFMAGGLRLVASLLPLQSAINSMIDGANKGALAFRRLQSVQNKTPSHRKVNFESPTARALGLTLQNVNFEFSEGKQILFDVSFSITPGTKVALVGPSGAGKTTCFEIGTGFRLPTSGLTLIDGKNPRDLLDFGLGAIGIVPQRPHLVSGSIAENVSLEETAFTNMEKVRDCLNLAGLAAFANSEALDMYVEPDAGQLSGGEIQRLGLARALYRDPGILFLDEATSALDAETEDQISKVLDGLRGKMTLVLIAHRLSTVANADKIIYLDRGRVLSEGTFKELQVRVPDFAKAIQLMEIN
jgi:ABC-type multidrug transport system fused ATPase/permease subunit